jgi:hypothetical protein
MKQKRFADNEDQLLTDAVNRIGTFDWKRIAKELPTFTARQCRERWNNYLNPNLIQTPWTLQEDQTLLAAFQEVGPKWTLIERSFPTRSRNNIKNRYLQLERIRKMEQKTSELDPSTGGIDASIPGSGQHPPNGAHPDLLDFLDSLENDDSMIWTRNPKFDDGSSSSS